MLRINSANHTYALNGNQAFYTVSPDPDNKKLVPNGACCGGEKKYVYHRPNNLPAIIYLNGRQLFFCDGKEDLDYIRGV